MSIAFDAQIPSVVMGKDASMDDMMQIHMSHRDELGKLWEGVAHDVLWQEIWSRFTEGRVDLNRWRLQAQPEVHTPPQKSRRKNRPKLPFTPDKPQRGSTGLLKRTNRNRLQVLW